MSKAAGGPIPGTEEAWDSGELGADDNYVGVFPDTTAEGIADASLGLQTISIRLEKSLIEEFKLIASLSGLRYQPLMRQCLKRFADAEIKRLFREHMAEKKRTESDTMKKKVARKPSQAA